MASKVSLSFGKLGDFEPRQFRMHPVATALGSVLALSPARGLAKPLAPSRGSDGPGFMLSRAPHAASCCADG
ncbi:MAG TPA: hypothetical protein VK582_03580 [Pyrinomonadaceae bacterium]|nr:hypothetical protein [Pyrinomonadaceae bacterium]